MADPAETEMKNELRVLDDLLGETRARYHRRETPFASSDKLIAIDREIREARTRPLSPELQVEVRDLTARLRALDPR
ncbi:MAG: hypothetical protein ACXWLR_14365 [Myxococcales bacterium]